MKKYENPDIQKQTIATLDPLGLSSKITIRKQTIALFYPLGLTLVITGIFLKNLPQPDAFLVVVGTVLSMAGGILVMISWIGALLNSVKMGRWGWVICLLFLALFALIVYLFAGPDPTRTSSESSRSV